MNLEFSGCSVASAMNSSGYLSSYEINSLLDVGVSVDDIMDCGYVSGCSVASLWIIVMKCMVGMVFLIMKLTLYLMREYQ